VPIVASVRDRESEEIEALDLGSDDLVSKLFGVGELLARRRTVLRHRRKRHSGKSIAVVGMLGIDDVRQQAKRDGEEIRLTSRLAPS